MLENQQNLTNLQLTLQDSYNHSSNSVNNMFFRAHGTLNEKIRSNNELSDKKIKELEVQRNAYLTTASQLLSQSNETRDTLKSLGDALEDLIIIETVNAAFFRYNPYI